MDLGDNMTINMGGRSQRLVPVAIESNPKRQIIREGLAVTADDRCLE